jgi:hypothetical protein
MGVQHSAEGAASAGRAKIRKQMKQQSRTWTPEEWALYRETRGDREERGSVVSTLLNEGDSYMSSSGSSDVANLRDFQDQDQSFYPEAIEEEEEEDAPAERDYGDNRVMLGRLRTAAEVEARKKAERSSSSTGGSSSYDYRAYDAKDSAYGQYRGNRKYRHVQNGARRATFLLAGLALVMPGEATSTVAILAPMGSTGVLLVMAKLFCLAAPSRW